MAKPQSRITWENKKQIADPSSLISILTAAGLPIHSTELEGFGKGEMVCITEVKEAEINGLVLTPTGLAFRFESPEFEPHFWKFAAENYYIVTGNAADRKWLAYLTSTTTEKISGLLIDRKKNEVLSGLSIDNLLSKFEISPTFTQDTLI